MTIDQAGNAYMVGAGFTTVKFDSSGDTLWTRNHEPNNGFTTEIAVDSRGFIYLADLGFRAVKYDSNGALLWSQAYANGFWPEGIGVDTAGNLYVAGDDNSGSSTDYAVVKFSPSGDTLWSRTFDGPANSVDILRAMAVSADGYVYVTGSTESGGLAQTDYATIKYAPNGDELWVALYDGPASGNDTGKCVLVDGGGNVYVTGTSPDADNDYLTIKYTPNGDTVWTAQYASAASLNDRPRAMVLDPAGNVYITGASYMGSTFYITNFTVRHETSDGTLAWSVNYPDIGSAIVDIAIDSNLDVVVAGSPSSGSHFVTAKYSQADADSDGIIDQYDNCLTTPNANQSNSDADTLGDACDNCISVDNPDQGFVVSLTGDVNTDSVLTSADIIGLVNYTFKSGDPPEPCVPAGDVNCSGNITSADIIYLVNHVFKGGSAPCDVCQGIGLGWTCP